MNSYSYNMLSIIQECIMETTGEFETINELKNMPLGELFDTYIPKGISFSAEYTPQTKSRYIKRL